MSAACDKSLSFSAIIPPAGPLEPRVEHHEDVNQPELQGRTDSLDCERHYIGNLLYESTEDSFCSEVSVASNNESFKSVTKKPKKSSVQKKIRYKTLTPVNLEFEPLTPLQLTKSTVPYQHHSQQINDHMRLNGYFDDLSDPCLPGQQFCQLPQNNIYNSKTYSAVAQQPRMEQWNGGDTQLDFQRLFNKPSSPSSNSSSSHSSATSVNTFIGHWSVGHLNKTRTFQPKKFTSQSNLLAYAAGSESVLSKPARIPGLNPVEQRTTAPMFSNRPKMLGKKQRSVGDFQLQLSNNNNRKKKANNFNSNGLKESTKHGSFSNFKSDLSVSINPPFIQSEPKNNLQKRSESTIQLFNEKDVERKQVDIHKMAPNKALSRNHLKGRFEVLESISRPTLEHLDKEQSHQRRSHSANTESEAPKQPAKQMIRVIDKAAHPLVDLSSAAKPKNLRRDSLEDASLPTLTKNGLMLILSNFMLFLASFFGSAQSGLRYISNNNNNYASMAAAGRRKNNGRAARKNVSDTAPALKFLYITFSTLWKALHISGQWITNLFVNFFVLLFRAIIVGSKLGFQNLLLLFYVCWTKIYWIGKKLAMECLQLHREISDQIQHLFEKALRRLRPEEGDLKTPQVLAINSDRDNNVGSSKSSSTWSLEAELEDSLLDQNRPLHVKDKISRKDVNKKSSKQKK